MTLPTEEQSSASDFKFALPDWPYDFWPLSPVASATWDQLAADRLITTKMLTVSPMKPSTDLTHFEARIYEEIAAYEEITGGSLRCDGFASRGKKRLGRLEAHLVFQKSPDMILLKRLMRKIGSVVVTGEYDSAEDWTHLSQDRKNHPPHNGCLHYVAQHADHPDNQRIWNKILPAGRKTVAPAKQDSVQSQRDAEFQRELENKVWLGQNNRPRRKTAIRGGLEAGERRAVRGFVVRTLPKPVPMMTAEQAAPRRRVLDAGKRRLLPNGQVVMTLPRSDWAALFGVGSITGGSRTAANGADRIDENIADVDAIPTGLPDSGTQSAVGKPGNGMLTVGRHTLVEIHLEEYEEKTWREWIYRTIKFIHTFRDDQGRRYRWYGSNPRPVNLRGYRYPGRYPVLRGVPLTFAANVREIWPNGTVSISRPYVRLDRQPEATRRVYAREFEIPLDELGLEEQ